MTEQHIIPRYKLVLQYDLIPGDGEAYYTFIMTELIPAASQMGLHIFQVFHTAWGDSPVRQVEFVVEDLATIRAVLDSDTWRTLENKLRQHSTNYKRKVIQFKPGFQL